jgi:hypothetical protein
VRRFTGNAQPTIGLREHLVFLHKREFYYQTKQTNQSSRTTFWSFTYKNFDALDKSSTQFDLGTNFFLDGQHKITAQYSARPVYTTPSNTSGSKGEFIVQLQIYL